MNLNNYLLQSTHKRRRFIVDARTSFLVITFCCVILCGCFGHYDEYRKNYRLALVDIDVEVKQLDELGSYPPTELLNSGQSEEYARLDAEHDKREKKFQQSQDKITSIVAHFQAK